MRVLGRIRLSRSTDESTSAERQREIIQTWADQNDHEVVGWAEDLDVSGAVDPFDTPSLGPWLSDRLGEWDILVAWKLDRLARRAVPLHRLFGLCHDEEKVLVCVSDNIDLSSWVGRLIASVIAGVAEGELEAIRERTKASHQKLRELGRWPGGKPAYGYRAVEREDAAGCVLEPDPYASEIVAEIVERVLQNQSVQSICEDLNTRGILPPAEYLRERSGRPSRGGRWRGQTMIALLRSKTLLGHVTHQGVTVRDASGAPIKKGVGLVDPEKFDQLQMALNARSAPKTRNRTTKASPLSGIVRCLECGLPLHHRGQRSNGNPYQYYYCRTPGHTQSIPFKWLMEEVEGALLSELGETEVQERVAVPASSHSAELAEARLSIEELSGLLTTMKSASAKSLILEQISALDQKVADLEKLPEREAQTVLRGTGETYAQMWERMEPEDRRQLLLKSEIVATARLRGRISNSSAGVLEFHLRVPHDLVSKVA